jgi:LysR family glycine cleavage system transcriptional activator
MIRRLPPLNSLRAFEASARHLSFSRAADELGVTASAISHQIKQLEEILGTALFVRMTRKIILTDAGRRALEPLTEAFDRMADAVELIAAQGKSGVLTVSAAPSFAGLWLVPRVEAFQAAHPEIDLRISANMQLVDFRRDEVDVAVRYGRGEYPDMNVDPLFPERLAPMCAPSLLEGPHPLMAPEDLRHHALIHDDSTAGMGLVADWRMWLRMAGCPQVESDRGARFSYADHALQAAMQGDGVVLGRLSLAGSHLEAGRLVRPFGNAVETDFGYFLVRPKTLPDPAKVTAFRDWILAETKCTAIKSDAEMA